MFAKEDLYSQMSVFGSIFLFNTLRKLRLLLTRKGIAVYLIVLEVVWMLQGAHICVIYALDTKVSYCR